jgi:hypothetical protein
MSDQTSATQKPKKGKKSGTTSSSTSIEKPNKAIKKSRSSIHEQDDTDEVMENPMKISLIIQLLFC